MLTWCLLSCQRITSQCQPSCNRESLNFWARLFAPSTSLLHVIGESFNSFLSIAVPSLNNTFCSSCRPQIKFLGGKASQISRRQHLLHQSGIEYQHGRHRTKLLCTRLLELQWLSQELALHITWPIQYDSCLRLLMTRSFSWLEILEDKHNRARHLEEVK